MGNMLKILMKAAKPLAIAASIALGDLIISAVRQIYAEETPTRKKKRKKAVVSKRRKPR